MSALINLDCVELIIKPDAYNDVVYQNKPVNNGSLTCNYHINVRQASHTW